MSYESTTSRRSKKFPVDDSKDARVECFSLMKPVGDIITVAQVASYPSGIDAFLRFCRLWTTVLKPDAPLGIYDSTSHKYNPERPSEVKQCGDLTKLAQDNRKRPEKALDKRFYTAYNGTKRSRMLEMQVFLHPAFKSLRCLESILAFHKAATVRAEVFEDIVARTCEIVAARDDEMESSVAEQESAKKKQKVHNHACSMQNEQLEQLDMSAIMTFWRF